MSGLTPDESAELQRRLLQEEPGLDERVVQALIENVATSFAAARIHQFVPILVERAVRERLASAPTKWRAGAQIVRRERTVSAGDGRR